jgi:hypothetical protein
MNPTPSRSVRAALLIPVLSLVCLGSICPAGVDLKDVWTVYVTVQGAGSGSGRVWATEPEFNCRFEAGVFARENGSSNACEVNFQDAGEGGVFPIRAEAAPGSVLAGWSGDCSGTGVCNATFASNENAVNVTVRFELAGAPPPMVVSDSFLVGDSWASRVVSSNGTVAQLAAPIATGGDPTGFRRMEHQIDGIGSIQVFHRYDGASYSPGTSGAIASLAYSEHRIMLDPPFAGAGVAAGFALEQGGQLFILPFGGYTNTAWQRFERSGIQASDFSPAPGPDFSAGGAPLRFGFVRSNSNTSTGLQRIQHGIDNWRVEVVRR